MVVTSALCSRSRSRFQSEPSHTPVLPEAPGGAETAAAGGAVERFVFAVNQLVRLQVVPLTEAPPTDAAHVGPGSGTR